VYKISQNPQVQYSLPHLTKGLFYHLQYKTFKDITVSEICETAGLTRRTFYRNCEKKEDLISYACDCLMNQLLADVDFNSTNARSMYRYFFKFWYEHQMFLHSLYKSDLFPLFEARFMFVCNQHIRFPLQDDAVRHHHKPEIARSFNNAFILGGLVNMLHIWTAEEFKSSAEDLVESILFLLPQKYHK